MRNRRTLWTFIIAVGCVVLLAPFSYWWLARPPLTAEQVGKEVAGSHPMSEQQSVGREHTIAPQGSQHGGRDTSSAHVAGSHSMSQQQPMGQEGQAAPEGSQHGGENTPSSAAPQQAPIQLSPAQQ